MPSVDVFRFLDADQIKKPKRRPDKKSEPSKSSLGSWREPRVDKHRRDATRMRLRGEIRPNLSFNENNLRRTNDRKCAADDWPKIKRCIHDVNPWRSVLVRQSKSGCGRRGQHTRHVRFKRSQLLGHLQGDHDFAYADRVQPCGAFPAPLGQSRAQVTVVNPQPLTEFFAITAAANHFHQIAGQKEQKPDRPKQIVDKTNHSIADRNRTSVAPYFFWRATCHGLVSGRASPGRFSNTNTPPGASNCCNFSLVRSFSVKRSPDFVFSYGGSAKTISNFSVSEAYRRKSKTSCCRTRASNFVLTRFFSMTLAACRSCSKKRTERAPRLSASIPSAPLPAKRSRIRAPIIASPKLEKIAALTRSIVGRTPLLGTDRRTPPALPAITLMATGPALWQGAASPRG